MRADDVLGSGSFREWAFLGVGILLSLVLHTVVAAGAAMIPERTRNKPEWLEMQLAEAPKPPPPPPEVKPLEPEKPKPEPLKKAEKVVDLKDLPKDPPAPDTPPPDKKRVARAVQGLSNDSFAAGAGGFGARQGNTTSVAPTSPSDPNAGAFVTVPYTSVGSAPKVRANPPMEVPKEVVDARVSGRVEMEITIDPDGRVVDAVVVGRLHPAADAACVAHVKRNVRFSAGTLDGAAVAVKGVPFSCRIEESTN